MLNWFKTDLLVWLQSVWHSFLSPFCCALPKHFRNNYVYFCEKCSGISILHPCFPRCCTRTGKYASIHYVCAGMCGVCAGVCVGSLCPGVRDLLQWLMGFLYEAPQGAVHNRWARPQPRQACPSLRREKKGRRAEGKYIPSLSFCSLFPPLCPSILLFPPENTFTATPTLFYSSTPFPLAPVLLWTQTVARTNSHVWQEKNMKTFKKKK